MTARPGFNDPRPPYAQVAAALRDAFEPGERLPNLDQLAESYGVAKMTVRRAIAELTDEGLVIVTRGVGTFYAAQRPEGATTGDDSPSALAAELRDLGKRATELAKRVAALARDERGK